VVTELGDDAEKPIKAIGVQRRSGRIVGLLLLLSLTVGSCGGTDSSSIAVVDGQGSTAEAATWTEVSSSNLAAIRYDPGVEQLDVRFLSGDTYRYFGVPEDVYEGLLHPPGGSHGKYFYAHIRDDFPYEKL